MKKTDGTGAPIVDTDEYFVQDARQVVGNCGSWWAPKGAGYVCNIDDAGRYTGKAARDMRDDDVPWPVDYVLTRAVRHVRVDNQAFRRHDDVAESARAVEDRAFKARIAKYDCALRAVAAEGDCALCGEHRGHDEGCDLAAETGTEQR